MTTNKTKKKDHRSVEEVGDWYDEHSATRVESESVEVKVERRYDPTFTMRIPEDVLQKLKSLADAQGVPTTTMARMLLLEALDRATDPTREAAELLATVIDHPRLLAAFRALVSSKGGSHGIKKARSLLRL